MESLNYVRNKILEKIKNESFLDEIAADEEFLIRLFSKESRVKRILENQGVVEIMLEDLGIYKKNRWRQNLVDATGLGGIVY